MWSLRKISVLGHLERAFLGSLLSLLLVSLPFGSAYAQLGDGDITVSATQGVEWDQINQVYIARGDAAVKQGDVEVYGQTLYAFYRDGADSGQAMSATGSIFRIEAIGEVKALLEGDQLKADKLIYDFDTDIVDAVGGQPVFQTRDGLVVQAGQSLRYDPNNLRAYAIGGVMANDGQARIRAQQMTLYFFPGVDGGQPSKIQSMLAQGQVIVSQEDGIAEADELLYDPVNQLAELKGNVNLVQPNGSIVSGDFVSFDFESGLGQVLAEDKKRVTVIIKPGEAPSSN